MKSHDYFSSLFHDPSITKAVAESSVTIVSSEFRRFTASENVASLTTGDAWQEKHFPQFFNYRKSSFIAFPPQQQITVGLSSSAELSYKFKLTILGYDESLGFIEDTIRLRVSF